MSGETYAAAGVSLEAADEAVARIRPHAARTARPEVLEAVGGFGGLFAPDLRAFREPVLVSATDGVGTKLELARQLGRHDTVGVDLVAMVVDDLVVPGAEPLFFLDYVAVERLDPAHVEAVVAGIAEGCVQAGCALVGGETAEHPGLLPPGGYDLAGFGVGVLERSALLGPARVRPGDSIVALAASGPHANGYSLIRRLVPEPSGWLADTLLAPTRIYARDCLALAAAAEVHAYCHVTGGGIPGNLPRALPDGLGAVVDTTTFAVPDVFGELQRRGRVAADEMWRVFNMGAGMLAVVPDAPAAVAVLAERDVPAWVCGYVEPRPDTALRL